MFAAWWLPRFPLQALHAAGHLPPVDCIAALDGIPGRLAQRGDASLACVTEALERRGVSPGMTVSQALARCPEMRSVYREEAAESQLQNRLLGWAEAWTPDYEATHPGLCLLDLRRVRNAATLAWEDHGRDMMTSLRAQALDARVGMAENADLAFLAARIADPLRILTAEKSAARQALGALPITTLSPPSEILEIFHLWGVRTLADLAALPRADVTARLGKAGTQLWQISRGGSERLLHLVRPQAVFEACLDLDAPIESLQPLMALLGQMLDQLIGRLRAAWQVAASLHLQLTFEDGSRHHQQLRVAEPTCDPAVLRRILETHLEGLTAAAPLTQMQLEITPARATTSQMNLFDAGLRDPNRFAETLSALEALLGHGRVGRPAHRPLRQPDAFFLHPFLQPVVAAPQAALPFAEAASTQTGLPLLRYRPPREIRVRLKNAVPQQLLCEGQTRPITAAHGPWKLSGGWWDRTLAWEQEVWDVRSLDGTLYRLVRQQNRWRLEGIYD
ncbi:MAG: DNA polymerase Y family protein [Verrucomicrobiales bacterium]|nr:DNA polymerase Y family protein [Verrucomicrobiales bacterium]